MSRINLKLKLLQVDVLYGKEINFNQNPLRLDFMVLKDSKERSIIKQ